MTNSITNPQSSHPEAALAAANRALSAALLRAPSDAVPPSLVVSAILEAAGAPPRDPNSDAGKAYSALLEACAEFAEAFADLTEAEWQEQWEAHQRDAAQARLRARRGGQRR
jgi:hypothetical protein